LENPLNVLIEKGMNCYKAEDFNVGKSSERETYLSISLDALK
jgi:hypothetical protein